MTTYLISQSPGMRTYYLRIRYPESEQQSGKPEFRPSGESIRNLQQLESRIIYSSDRGHHFIPDPDTLSERDIDRLSKLINRVDRGSSKPF